MLNDKGWVEIRGEYERVLPGGRIVAVFYLRGLGWSFYERLSGPGVGEIWPEPQPIYPTAADAMAAADRFFARKGQ